MLTAALLALALSGPVAAPLHVQSASSMPVGGVVRDRSAGAPGEATREVCHRGKPTGSNVTQDLCRQVPVARATERSADAKF
ncbi:hypothetical protein [Brevundimonas sp.]|uniref:hypothetical protein n=1 Tax=Brevundimonas sp. TaxID=1871086 RepID=UPI003D6CDAAA